MTETYTEAELAQAWKDLDTISTDYNIDKLHRICLQARKNRLWEAQKGTEQVQSGIHYIDEVKAKLNLPPWRRGDEGDSPAAG